MLRTNLATRPFYNERAVHFALALVALLVAALTAYNVWRLTALTREQRDLSGRVAAAEADAQQLRVRAAQIRQSLNPQDLRAVSSSTREANTIIERRLFSWTELFNRLETTLPDDVRITSVRPRVGGEAHVEIAMTVIGRRVEDLHEFIENLEATGVFANLLSTNERANEDGSIQATIRTEYRPSRASGQP
jgi:hypothetical protein